MAISVIASIYDELLEYLASKATPQAVLAYKASDDAEARAIYLTERNKAGMLTSEEQDELDQLLAFDSKVGLLKARAALTLKEQA